MQVIVQGVLVVSSPDKGLGQEEYPACAIWNMRMKNDPAFAFILAGTAEE